MQTTSRGSNLPSDFVIGTSTPVAVDADRDPAGVGIAIEAELLGLGLEVVPMEVARTRIETERAIEVDENRIMETTSSGRTTYVPAGIVLEVRYRYTQGFWQSIQQTSVRVIDLDTERLLAVYDTRRYGTTARRIARLFSSEFERYIDYGL
jgi:hypothetical protein